LPHFVKIWQAINLAVSADTVIFTCLVVFVFFGFSYERGLVISCVPDDFRRIFFALHSPAWLSACSRMQQFILYVNLFTRWSRLPLPSGRMLLLRCQRGQPCRSSLSWFNESILQAVADFGRLSSAPAPRNERACPATCWFQAGPVFKKVSSSFHYLQ